MRKSSYNCCIKYSVFKSEFWIRVGVSIPTSNPLAMNFCQQMHHVQKLRFIRYIFTSCELHIYSFPDSVLRSLNVTLQGNLDLSIPRKGIARRPQSQFPHSRVSEFPRSVHLFSCSRIGGGNL
jgi:hypothetical protein